MKHQLVSVEPHFTEEFPLLALSADPSTLGVILDEATSDLSKTELDLLTNSGTYGEVMAVLVESKLAGFDMNLTEAVSLAHCEHRVADYVRDSHPMEFSKSDLHDIMQAYLPATETPAERSSVLSSLKKVACVAMCCLSLTAVTLRHRQTAKTAALHHRTFAMRRAYANAPLELVA